MNKKPGAAAIIVAVLVSILMFPFVIGAGLTSGAVFSAEALLQPGREDELFERFMNPETVDWIYESFESELQSALVDVEELNIDMEQFFSKQDVEAMIRDIYTAFVAEEKYTADLSKQKAYLMTAAEDYFENNIEAMIKEETGELYELLTEEEKAQILEEAKQEYDSYVQTSVLTYMDEAETEVENEINAWYESSEYAQLKELERKIGFRIFERTELCKTLHMAGIIVFGIYVVFLALLLLGHLFRPAGFFVAGVYSLLCGGIMKVCSMLLPGYFDKLLYTEMANEEEIPVQILRSVCDMASDIIRWFMQGFDKAGMWCLYLGIILALVGVLLCVIRRNQTENN